jgi:hypothetical protein
MHAVENVRVIGQLAVEVTAISEVVSDLPGGAEPGERRADPAGRKTGAGCNGRQVDPRLPRQQR